MTSEEIIQRLLDDKKISVKEAIVILKDLAKIGLQQITPSIFPEEKKKVWGDTIVTVYGVTTNPYTYSDNESFGSAISNDSFQDNIKP